MEYTIRGDKKEGVCLSKQILKVLPESNASSFVSLALEEITLYILDINDNLDWIDIIVRDSEETVIISIKYSGKGYNPKEIDNMDSDNVKKLGNLLDDIEYSQILGLNNTVITINK